MLRYTEELLLVGDQLTVLGELRSHSEVSSIETNTVSVLREWKKDQRELLARFDTNRDGKIDPQEWEAARAAAAEVGEAKTLQSPVQRTSIIGQSTNDLPFVIASAEAKQLSRSEMWKALTYLLIGIGCSTAFAWILIAALRWHR